jgi:penicillin-binding protein
MTSKKIAMIIGTIVAIGALGGGTYWYFQGTKEREVKQLADNYFEALEKGSYEKMVESFNPTSIKNSGYTEKEVLDKYQLVFSALHTDNAKVSDVKIEKNKEEYTISYTVSFDTFLGKLEDVAYQTTVEFVDNQPVIDWAPSLIFPQMEGKDKINIQEDPAERGEIVDRNGEKLATNRDYQQLGLNPSKLGDGEEKEQRLQAISEAFSVSVDQV